MGCSSAARASPQGARLREAGVPRGAERRAGRAFRRDQAFPAGLGAGEAGGRAGEKLGPCRGGPAGRAPRGSLARGVRRGGRPGGHRLGCQSNRGLAVPCIPGRRAGHPPLQSG